MNAYKMYEYCWTRSISLSRYAASWLNAYISNSAKNKQQIDLRTSGSNRKRPLSDSVNVLPGIYQFMSLL